MSKTYISKDGLDLTSAQGQYVRVQEDGKSLKSEADLYINGYPEVEDSHRFTIDPVNDITEIQKFVDGFWQPGSLELGPDSLWVGKNVGIAGVGHHLATETSSGKLHFHAHSEFDGEVTTEDVKVLYADNHEQRRIFQADDSGSWTGTDFSYAFPTPSSTIISKGYFKTHTTPATKPVRVRVWEGMDDTGPMTFDQTYPTALFTAETEVGMVFDGYAEYTKDQTYFIRISSDETFSLKMEETNTWPWQAADVSDVIEDNLLQTAPYVSGDSYDFGQYLIHERKIYKCLETGEQTGSFASNYDKWHEISGEHDVTNYITRYILDHWYSNPTINEWEERGSVQAWTKIACSSDTQYVTALVGNGKIYTSSDYGVTFTERDSVRLWNDVAMSGDGQWQVAVGVSEEIYVSSNYGVTWTGKDSSRTWLSVGMNSTGQYMTAGAGSEIYVSSDYGENWTLKSKTGSMRCVAVSSTGQYQAVGASGEGIYVSSNYGSTFAKKATIWNWRGIAMSSDGHYMTCVPDSQRPYVSDDYGLTWTFEDDTYRDYVDVCMSADGLYQMAVVGSGKVYVSVWKGNDWVQDDGTDRDWRGIACSADGLTVIGTVNDDNLLHKQLNSWSMDKAVDDDSWRAVAVSSNGKYQTAVGDGSTLQYSHDYGVTWASAATGPHDCFGVAMSSDGKYQTTIDMYADIFRSTDYGVTWEAVSAGNPAWTSVAMGTDGKFQVAVCGGEGSAEYIYISNDYGVTWGQKGFEAYWYSVACSSDGKYITCANGSGKLYRSTDYGETWGEVSVSFNWRAIAMSADGQYQTAVNAEDDKKIYVSTNYGATWSQKGIKGDAYCVAMSSDGKYQIVGYDSYDINYNLWISNDYGQTWNLIYGTRGGTWEDVKMSADGKYILAANYSNGIYTYKFSTNINGDVVINGTLNQSALVNADNWDDAYSWGDHAGLYEETGSIATHTAIDNAHHDKYVDASAVSAIKADEDWNASDWDTAYGWGDHAGLYEDDGDIATHAAIDDSHHVKYLDAAAVAAIKADGDWNASDWDEAHGWGDHSIENYLVSGTGISVSDLEIENAGTLQFSEQVGAKILLYNDTYVIGVESGELKIASNTAIIFYTGGYDPGTELARFESDGKFKVVNSIRTPKIWAPDDLKLQAGAGGDINMFDTADSIANGANSKMLYIWRKAPEGNDYIRFYISQSRQCYCHANNNMSFQAQVNFTINSVTQNIYFKVGDNAGAKKFYWRDSDNANVMILDSNGQLSLLGLPTVADGLSAGDVWNNSGVLNIVV